MGHRLRLLLIAALLCFPACHQVVRDAGTYQQELRFFAASGTRLADQLLAQAHVHQAAGDAHGCVTLAEDALVVKYRQPWHVAQALFAAGLGPDPGPPPAVPMAVTWCATLSHAAVVIP